MQGLSDKIIQDTKSRISGLGKLYADSYQKNKDRRAQYVGPTSDRQLSTILRFANVTEYTALFVLISKFVRMGNNSKKYRQTTHDLLRNPVSDKQTYLSLKKQIPKSTDYQPNEQYSFVSLYYANIFTDAGCKLSDSAEYLDIGCGTGYKAKRLGTDLGLPLSQVYGVDVKQWSVLTEDLRKSLDINFEFIDTSGSLPFADSKFELITIFMVLHHVTEREKLLAEIHRTLKPGGYLMIREHDCRDAIDYMMADVEHMLYDFIKIDNYDPAKFVNESKMRYLCSDEWTTIIEVVGFKLTAWGFDFTTPKSVISATRSYYAIYTRV